jgi:hypothetical protein
MLSQAERAVTPELQRPRQEDLEFEASLGYLVRTFLKRKEKNSVISNTAGHRAGIWGERKSLLPSPSCFLF